ncbi:MAG: glutathione S-transferase family protein [Sphingomicrobium sp.]
MADITFYTNPMSRGQIVRWMLEEIGQPYDTEIMDYSSTMKGDAYRAVNPMMKVPAIVHRGQAVTECAGIIAYLADVYPDAGLGPREDEKADYYRWLFFAAGPIEYAVTNKAAGFEPSEEKGRMFGYGTYDLAVTTLSDHFTSNDYVCGDRFTAADVYVGSQVLWGTQFGTLPSLPPFLAYAERLGARDAYQRAKAIDGKLIAEMQASAPA